MIDALFNQTNYVATKRLLDVTALRQEAVAANLANIDTPHYKRVDVNPAFVNELRAAIVAGDTRRIDGSQPHLALDSKAVAVGRDGNNVDLEKELMTQNQNALEHSFETQMVSGALLRLRLAITGRSA